jgi:hypothetical protein
MLQVGATEIEAKEEEGEEEDSRDKHTGYNLPDINLKLCIVLNYFSSKFPRRC